MRNAEALSGTMIVAMATVGAHELPRPELRFAKGGTVRSTGAKHYWDAFVARSLAGCEIHFRRRLWREGGYNFFHAPAASR